MRFTVLTLFPEIIEGYFASSIMAKAVEKGLIEYSAVNIRDYAEDKHKTCDDAPYGGGAGMVLKPAPLASAIENNYSGERVIYMSASGRRFTQETALELSRETGLMLICGRYEGVDQRIIDRYVDMELCIGDFVLSSGEVAALACVDSVYRLCEGIINSESLEEESFQNGLLEYPHYTRPENFQGMKVPEVLLSGHHEKIQAWRLSKSVEKTMKNRQDLLKKVCNREDIAEIYQKIADGKENEDEFNQGN